MGSGIISGLDSVPALVEMVRARARALKEGRKRSRITLQYEVDAEDILVQDGAIMAHWSLHTTGLAESGFASDVHVDGMLKARFNRHSNLLLEVRRHVTRQWRASRKGRIASCSQRRATATQRSLLDEAKSSRRARASQKKGSISRRCALHNKAQRNWNRPSRGPPDRPTD
jgi:hypothetical protein